MMQLLWMFTRLKAEGSKNNRSNPVIWYTNHEGQLVGECECSFVCIGWGGGKEQTKENQFLLNAQIRVVFPPTSR